MWHLVSVISPLLSACAWMSVPRHQFSVLSLGSAQCCPDSCSREAMWQAHLPLHALHLEGNQGRLPAGCVWPLVLCPHFPSVGLLTQGIWPYKCSHASVSCLSLGNRQWVLPFAIQSVLPEVAGTLSDPAEVMHREELSFHLQGEGGRCASPLTPDPRGCCPDSTAFLGEVRPFMKPLLKNCSACEGTASALQWGTRYLSHRELMWDTSCLYAAHEARKVYLLLELLCHI